MIVIWVFIGMFDFLLYYFLSDSRIYGMIKVSFKQNIYSSYNVLFANQVVKGLCINDIPNAVNQLHTIYYEKQSLHIFLNIFWMTSSVHVAPSEICWLVGRKLLDDVTSSILCSHWHNNASENTVSILEYIFLCSIFFSLILSSVYCFASSENLDAW